MLRGLRVGALALVLALATVLGLALVLGRAHIVVTDGVSMNPVYYEGDLVIVAVANSYDVGDIVAYRDHEHDLIVLHRIMAIDSRGYVFKGDNNQSIDGVYPARGDLLGRAALHVSGAGTWLRRLRQPLPLAVLGFVVIGSGGGAVQHRRRRSRRRVMPAHSASTGRSSAVLPTQSPQIRAAAGVTAGTAALGLALAGFSWLGPVDAAGSTDSIAKREMTFAYSTEVPRSAAYDGTIVTSPATVFRRLTDTVDVHFAYSGDPGSVAVVAELSTTGGWRSTLPLAVRTAFTGDRHAGSVRLDLNDIERRAEAAAKITGLPADPVQVRVVPQVETNAGASFTPGFELTLTPLQLMAAGNTASFTVTDSTTTKQAIRTPRTVSVLGRQVTVRLLRTLSLVLLLGGLLAAACIGLIVRRTPRDSEGAGIRRRYAPLLVPVHPMPTPPGRPVVDVPEFQTLARLAERYGLLVLHWSRSDVETFVVQDENTTYRYRTAGFTPETLAETDTDDPAEAETAAALASTSVPPRITYEPWPVYGTAGAAAAEQR